jgi:trehalose-6-phosphate synthase
MEKTMSDIHFIHADQSLRDEYKRYLDQVAEEMGRTNSRDDRVDWQAVNEKMKLWWAEKGYRFP